MKKLKKIINTLTVFTLIFVLALATACSNGFEDDDPDTGTEVIVTWKGSLPSHPENPEENWAYYNLVEGKIYTYNGTAWEVLEDGYYPGYNPGSDPGNLEMVTVPACTEGFTMGEGVTASLQKVESISSFKMGRYEVTFDLWSSVKQYADENGYTIGAGAGAERCPVTNVSWRDSIAWCNALSELNGLTPCYYLSGKEHTTENVYRNSATGGDITNSDVDWDANGYRLPTDAEWEYAARYLNGTEFTQGDRPSGAEADGLESIYAWHEHTATAWVGFKAPNALGIYDMSGNVWEYVWDWYRGYDGDTGANPHGPNIGDKRIHRGGSWVDLVSSGYFRTSNRNSGDTDILAVNLGLRLARNL